MAIAAAQITLVAEVITSVVFASAITKGVYDTLRSVIKEKIAKSLSGREAIAPLSEQDLLSMKASINHLESTISRLIEDNNNLKGLLEKQNMKDRTQVGR